MSGGHLPPQPRPCRRCWVVKPPTTEAFPPGRKARIGYVCWPCVEEEAWAMKDRYVSPEKRRTTRVNENGVKMRICSRCKIEKRLCKTNFYVNKRDERGRIVNYNYECAKCTVPNVTRLNREKRNGPERKKILARKAKRQRERKKQDPVLREKHRESQQRYWAKVKADPVLHAKHVENQRIAYRMRREREGKVPKTSFKKVIRSETAPSYIPAGPLVLLVDQILEHRKAVAGLIHDAGEATVAAVCGDLGVSQRTYRHWSEGEDGKVRIGTAESVLARAGVEWSDVYSFDDYAHIFLAERTEA
jgi:hypothetical protein